MRLSGFGWNPEHPSESVHGAGTGHDLEGREGTALTLTGGWVIAIPHDREV